MFEKQAVVFLYCVSPVHMGAGTATGVIDNPIQRERHTRYPSFAGSGIKGAIRHAFPVLSPDADAKRERIFGPGSGTTELHAGAVSFGDAQLVAFPIRSLRRGYVYATCPLALARAKRLLHLTGRAADWPEPDVEEGRCRLTQEGAEELLREDKLDLEVFQYTAEHGADVAHIAAWLADHALPEKHVPDFFRNKLRRHLVVLSNTDFGYFVENATLVEAHVRIDESRGAADRGGLFYTENLPSESLLIAPLMASRERTDGDGGMLADQVMAHIRTAVHGQVVQLGGDATTGRGLVAVNVLGGE